MDPPDRFAEGMDGTDGGLGARRWRDNGEVTLDNGEVTLVNPIVSVIPFVVISSLIWFTVSRVRRFLKNRRFGTLARPK